jgi:hypothetical protein
MHNAPGFPAQHDYLFRCPQTVAFPSGYKDDRTAAPISGGIGSQAALESCPWGSMTNLFATPASKFL